MAMKKTIVISLGAAVLLAVIYYFSRGRETESAYTTDTARVESLVQTVSETATVRPAQSVQLSFPLAGRLVLLPAKTGEAVVAGQVLAELDQAGLLIKEKEATAVLAGVQSELAKLAAGASSEDISVSEANLSQMEVNYQAGLKELSAIRQAGEENVAQAEKSWKDLSENNPDNITPTEQAVVKAEDNLKNTLLVDGQDFADKRQIGLNSAEARLAEINTALDKIQIIFDDEDARYLLGAQEPSLVDQAKQAKLAAAAGQGLASAKLAAAKNSRESAPAQEALDIGLALLDQTFRALNLVYQVLENSIPSAAFTALELEAYKTGISAQLTTIAQGTSALKTAEQNFKKADLIYTTNKNSAENSLKEAQAAWRAALNAAENSLASACLAANQQLAAAQSKVDNAREAAAVARANLAKIKSPARAEDLSLLAARIDQAQAGLETIRHQKQESRLAAPFAGVIKNVFFEIGEQVSAGVPIVELFSEDSFAIDLDVSETDIAKLAVGQAAIITLDAFGDDVKLVGAVAEIEPAETVLQEVIYYRTKVNFQADGQPVKSGLTANVAITTAQKDQVLLVPMRAVIQKPEGKFIRVLRAGQAVEKPVQTGLISDGGRVEIISGLSAGETVITAIKNNQ